MSHEPECAYQPEVVGYGYTSGFGEVDRSNFRAYQPAKPCSCDGLRAAYQRGQEDAAQIAEGFGLNYPISVWPPFAADDKGVSRDRVSASMGRHVSNVIAGLIRAAARGESEKG